MTPELVSEEHLIGEHRPERAELEDADHAVPCQRLFPIFRPKSQWKVCQAAPLLRFLRGFPCSAAPSQCLYLLCILVTGDDC